MMVTAVPRSIGSASTQSQAGSPQSVGNAMWPAVNPFTAPPLDVPRRPLLVHGPFEVTSADLTKASTQVTNNSSADATGSDDSQSGEGEDAGESDGAQSPEATRRFDDVSGLNGMDPGIAVGTSYLLVCDNVHGIAAYDKSGSGHLLSAKTGQPIFQNPFSISSLFAKVKADITPHLNLPSGLPPNFPTQIPAYGDVRIMFDAYRKRFWVYARAKLDIENPAEDIVKYPALKLARRQKAAVAVSKTDDPRDGFYTYWWNETIHNGECNNQNGCSDPLFKTSGEGADYPSIGISPKFFIATAGVNRRDPAFPTDTVAAAQKWKDCETNFVANGHPFNWCGPFYIHLMIVDADRLAQGPVSLPQISQPLQRPQDRSFALFIDAKNYITDRAENADFAHGMGRGVKPVIMHGPQLSATIHSAEAYFTNTFIDRSGSTPKCYVVLWSLFGNELIPELYPIRRVTFPNPKSWNFIFSASYRDGKLYAALHECVVWKSQKPCLYSVRALRINTSNSKTEIDRTFGLRNKIDDPSNARINYKWPAIEVNKHGDMVLSYVRFSTESPTLPQEVRFSVWYHGDPDIRPSRLLRAGEIVNAFDMDTSAIAVDPVDDEGIWIAHFFATENGSKRIAVGRVFGHEFNITDRPNFKKRP